MVFSVKFWIIWMRLHIKSGWGHISRFSLNAYHKFGFVTQQFFQENNWKTYRYADIVIFYVTVLYWYSKAMYTFLFIFYVFEF